VFAGGPALSSTTVKTDANGRATFSGLSIAAAGQYVLDFVATGYSEHAVDLTVNPAP